MRGFCFGICILVQRCKQYHGDIGVHFLTPTIVLDYDVMRDVHQVVERNLQGLLERKQLTLVRSGVVALAFARSRTHQIGMDVVAVASDVTGFLNILAPVATFLACLDDIDTHHLDFASVRIDVVAGYPDLAGVLDAGNKLLDILLFLLHALHLLQRVGNPFFGTNITPVILVHFDLILHTGMVTELRFLALTNQSLDVVPVAPENAGIIWDGIILKSGCRKTHQDSELAFGCPNFCHTVPARFTPHQHHQVAQRVARIQQPDDFVVLIRQG